MGLRFYKKCIIIIGVLIFIFAFQYYYNKVLLLEYDNKFTTEQSLIRDVYNRKKILPNSDCLFSIECKQNKIKEMTKFAWENYKLYAWGYNELKPITKNGHYPSIFGYNRIGATIIDAIDTLYIMNLTKEFEEARQYIAYNFSLKSAIGKISVFETNIRFLGGLLSTYALTKDKLFLQKAKEVADFILPAFDTPTGIPYSYVFGQFDNNRNRRTVEDCSVLAEIGSLGLEFEYLSRELNNFTYANKTKQVTNILNKTEKYDGLYSLYINRNTGRFCSKQFSVGGMGDSFYEYLFKVWLLNNKTDFQLKKMYDDAIEAVIKKMLKKSEKDLFYFAEITFSRIEHKMGHLTCYIAGLFALQSVHEIDVEKKKRFLEYGEEIAHTCHKSYINSPIGLGPEVMRFSSQLDAQTNRDAEMYYILRPEVIESWFLLWRITKNEKYRDWCWDAAKAIERFCKVKNGYSGIKSVYNKPVVHDNVQQSYFFAETLKYLYLTFSDSNLISLDKWVFNTEAHPFPITKNNLK